MSQWFEMADFHLADLLSSAGATAGIVIAGTIFLQFMNTRHTELSGRYRSLTGEYRERRKEDPRHRPLQDQIHQFQSRLKWMNWASWIASIGLISLLVALLMGGTTTVFPQIPWDDFVGALALMIGLLLSTVAVLFHLVENIIARREVVSEAADLDEPTQVGGRRGA